MANDVMFEGKERRMAKIEKCLAEYNLPSLEEARALCLSKGVDCEKIVKACSRSRLKTRCGPTRGAAQSRFRKT